MPVPTTGQAEGVAHQMRETVYSQSAVLPYRVRDGRLEVALITNRSGSRWIIPKGLVEPGESPPESALREAEEEAGLSGEVERRRLCRYAYRKWGGTCVVDVFLMLVTRIRRRWPEDDFREREWCSLREAARRVKEPEIKRVIMALDEQVVIERRASA